MTETVRVFAGTEPRTTVACKVLESSLRRRTSATVEFTPMTDERWQLDVAHLATGTGFSLKRWLIPAVCGWRGRAVYLDADQLLLGDVLGLWRQPDLVPAPETTSAWLTYQRDGAHPGVWPNTSVMVIDCVAAQYQWGWYRDRVLEHLNACAGKPQAGAAYLEFMRAGWMRPKPARIAAAWNSLEKVEAGQTRLVHFTRSQNAPWFDPNHRHAKLWQAELGAAVAAGLVGRRDLEEALAAWGRTDKTDRRKQGLHPHYSKYLKGAS